MDKVIKLLVTGGIISPGNLEQVAFIAQSHSSDYISIGSRQELYISCPEAEVKVLEKKISKIGFQTEVGQQQYYNIVTSFASVGIYPSTTWVTGDTFFDVLEEFDYYPKLRINITDPQQRLIPIFGCNLNFIASHHLNYWYLYIQLPGSIHRELWPALIYIDEVAALSKKIEEIYYNHNITTASELFDKIWNETIKNSRAVDKELILVKKSIPYYEGMNPVNNSYWLGIYRRDYQYPLNFILDMCELCNKSKMGKISLTTWRTILIKDIKEEDRIKWEVLLGKHGINIRHSSLELHWQLPDMDEEALRLKKHLVKSFDDKDTRTYGLSFSINTSEIYPFTNVVIKKNEELATSFDILYTPDFNPDNDQYLVYKYQIPEEELSESLKALCLFYYSQLNLHSGQKEQQSEKKLTLKNYNLFQCKTCFTIYNEEIGDAVNGISAGITFENLPDSYTCPICEGSKIDYVSIETNVAL